MPPPRGPDRPFLALWTATAAANLGDGVRLAALPLLVATLTDDPRLVAGLTAAVYAPWLLLGLQAGVIADRHDRRAVLLWATAARAALLTLLAVLVLTGVAGVAVLYATAFAIGAGEAVFDTAAQAAVPAVAAPDRLHDANGQIVSATVIANEFAGPPMGSALFAIAPAAPLLANTALLALAGAAVRTLPPLRTHQPEQRRGMAAEVIEGLRWLRGDPLVLALAVGGAVLGVVNVAWGSLLVLFALQRLGIQEAGYGVLLASGAAGGVLGGLTASRITRAVGPAGALAIAILGAGAAQALLALTDQAWIAGVLLAVTSFVFAVWNVVAPTLRQQLVPAALLGRVNAAVRTVSMGLLPAGAVLGGVLADIGGVTAPMLWTAPVLLLLGLAPLPLARRHAARLTDASGP